MSAIEWWSAPQAASALVIALVIFCATIVLFVSGGLFLCRQTPVALASSPFFLATTLGGALVGSLLPLLTLAEFADPTPELCVFRPLLASCGFSIAFGALLVKNYRIYRIFGQTDMSVMAKVR